MFPLAWTQGCHRSRWPRGAVADSQDRAIFKGTPTVRNISRALGRAMRTRTGGALSLVAGIGIMVAGLFPATLIAGASAAAPGVEDIGLFELDGNVAQDAATPPPYDWQCIFDTPAQAGCPASAPAPADKVFQPDSVTPDPTYFSSNGAGVKDIDLMSQWGCVTLNNPLSKDDILNAYGAAFILPQNWSVPAGDPVQPGDVIVTLAQERGSNNGNSFAGFWLLKSSHTCSNGGFSGAHDPGDLLVVSNYTNGGNTATVELYQWTNDPAVSNHLVQLGSGFTCGQNPPAGITQAGLMCAIANGGPINEPWAPSQTLQSNQFVEVGLDLTALIPPTTDVTACFGQFLAETRSSQELTATLKDYTGGQFKLCVNPTVTTQQTAGGHTAASQVVAPGTAVTDQASLSGAISGTPGGTVEYKLTQGTSCSGTVVYDSGALSLSGGVVPASGAAHPTALGQYEWQAFYSGDVPTGRNRAGKSTCGDEPLTVVDANVSIVQSAINDVGHDHVFTVTVNALGATGINVSYDSISASAVDSGSNQPSASTSTCATPVISNGGDTATCTLTISNTVQDEFVANASASLHIGGVAFSRTTAPDGSLAGPNGSGPSTKDYVDGSVALSPLNAENAVGAPHTFHVTVNAYHPAGVSASFTSIVPVLTEASGTPAPTTDTSTCGSPVLSNSGDTAGCTVTINSSSSGTYHLNATTHIRFTKSGVSDLTIVRSTDSGIAVSGPNGTGEATKVYDAPHVTIDPTAVNEIGHQHVFTVTAYSIPNSTTTFDSIDVSVLDSGGNPPGTMSTTCNNPTLSTVAGADQASCTVTVDNTTPDVFTAGATVHLTVNGFATSVSTNGVGLNSGPATKTYVSANIGLTPLTADDPVGDLHTITATVTTDDGSGSGAQPARDGTVVDWSIQSGPGSLATPSCTVSGGKGTCTDVLTSNLAGTTVVRATVTVTVDTVQLTRTTADHIVGDSTDATKNWHKLQPSIATVPSAGGTLGLASVSDTATVSGGLSPTGTVTFQLFAPSDTTCSGTPVFVSADRPLDNGSASSGGYTPTATGTFQWVATYNGDDANLTAVSGCGDEPVSIVASAVLGITTPNTGAELDTALAEGIGLMLGGSGIVILARTRRTRMRGH